MSPTGTRKVCRRTDARSITTTYSYDAENRLTSKTYSDSTPAAYYYYDESSVSLPNNHSETIANGKGRLTHTSADGGQAITVTDYDAVGRIDDFWQQVAGGCRIYRYCPDACRACAEGLKAVLFDRASKRAIGPYGCAESAREPRCVPSQSEL